MGGSRGEKETNDVKDLQRKEMKSRVPSLAGTRATLVFVASLGLTSEPCIETDSQLDWI